MKDKIKKDILLSKIGDMNLFKLGTTTEEIDHFLDLIYRSMSEYSNQVNSNLFKVLQEIIEHVDTFKRPMPCNLVMIRQKALKAIEQDGSKTLGNE